MSADDRAQTSHSGNMTGIGAMIASQAAFTANDTCIKLLNENVPLGEIILLRNIIATFYILIFAAVCGGLSLPRSPPIKLLSFRLAGELLSTILFLSGLVALPIADATAIGQLTPLAITAAAAIHLREPVGLRRWLAALAGFLGVLLIVRPGTEAFQPAALLILGAVATVVLRDLSTRYIATSISTLTLTLMSSVAGIFAGVVLLPFEKLVPLRLSDLAFLALCAFFLSLGYIYVVVAMRNGEVGVVSPFRYTVILFALLSGWLVWHQIPDPLQMLGIGIVSAAGLYTFHRERQGVNAAGSDSTQRESLS